MDEEGGEVPSTEMCVESTFESKLSALGTNIFNFLMLISPPPPPTSPAPSFLPLLLPSSASVANNKNIYSETSEDTLKYKYS